MSERLNLLYAPGEGIFSLAGPLMVARGWSVFPQERDGRRRPGRSGDQTIAWGKLSERLPTDEELEAWCRDCGSLNVACAMGPASGNAFCLDIDCLDPALSAAVRDAAFRVLGRTPFVRIGRAPKVALVYRHPPGDAPRNRHLRFCAPGDVDQASPGDGLEILSKGKPLTLHGLHHSTGRWFQWPESNPIIAGPEDAPEVSAAAVDAFLEEAARARPFFRGGDTGGGLRIGAEDWGDAGGLRVPVARAFPGYPVDADGRVSDMREKYLTSLVFSVVTANKRELLRAFAAGGDEAAGACGRIARAVCDVFAETAAVDARWRVRLSRDAAAKVGHLASKVVAAPEGYPEPGQGQSRSFRVLPPAPTTTRTEGRAAAPSPGDGAAWELSWLRASPRVPLRGWYEPPAEGDHGVPLRGDRDAVGEAIGDAIEAAIDAFLDEAFESPSDRPGGLHVLDAPTGAGKTSRMIRRLAADPRTYAGDAAGEGRPFVMLLPTYGNIDELRARAVVLDIDPSLPDAELARAAAALGVTDEADAMRRIGELRRDAAGAAVLARAAGSPAGGFRTEVYSGKVRAGCAFPEKVELAMAAGVGSSTFCRATVPDGRGGAREEVCPRHDGCPAIAQRERARRAHLVFMPHPFLALSLPEELEDARGVIADERVHHLFLHAAEVRAATLAAPRRPPRLTKAERDGGLDPQDVLADRSEAGRILLAALARGQCPASALLAAGGGREVDGTPLGRHLVRAALRVCGDGVRRDGNLSPSTSFEAVRAWCARPVGREIREELRVWQVVDDRISLLLRDAALDPARALREAEEALAAIPESAAPDDRRRAARRVAALARLGGAFAKGPRDARLQLVEEGEGEAAVQKVRVSWRTAPNWDGVPTILLDASAAPDVVAKVWGMPRDRIAVHRATEDFGALLNLRTVAVASATFSNASLVPPEDAPPAARLRAAAALARVRDAVAAVCAAHADGRVVAGASILVREAVCRDWSSPPNLDWCHFGAMRGLDMFRHHAAAVSVGRMELPVRTVDGLVAALTHDDRDPEEPFDARGDGRDASGRPLALPPVPRGLRMRDGGRAFLDLPCYPGRWAAVIQAQYREEELLQFVGRLRPVYRQGRPPVWYALTSVIPEGVVVDDAVSMEDILGGVPAGPTLWSAARRMGGFLEPRLCAAACGDLFPSPADAARVLRAAGFDPAAGTWRGGHAPRAWQGWAVVPLGEGSYGLAMSFDPGPAAALASAWSTGLPPGSPPPPPATAPPRDPFLSLAGARPPDSVDARLGTSAERAAGEQRALDALGVSVLRGDVELHAASGTVEGTWAGRRASLSIPEILALRAAESARSDRSRRATGSVGGAPVREGDESPAWDTLPQA